MSDGLSAAAYAKASAAEALAESVESDQVDLATSVDVRAPLTSSQYGSLQAALTDAASRGRDLKIDTDHVLTAGVTLPEGIGTVWAERALVRAVVPVLNLITVQGEDCTIEGGLTLSTSAFSYGGSAIYLGEGVRRFAAHGVAVTDSPMAAALKVSQPDVEDVSWDGFVRGAAFAVYADQNAGNGLRNLKVRGDFLDIYYDAVNLNFPVVGQGILDYDVDCYIEMFLGLYTLESSMNATDLAGVDTAATVKLDTIVSELSRRGASLPPNGKIGIQSGAAIEYLTYSSITDGDTLAISARGVAGSAPAAHAPGDKVFFGSPESGFGVALAGAGEGVVRARIGQARTQGIHIEDETSGVTIPYLRIRDVGGYGVTDYPLVGHITGGGGRSQGVGVELLDATGISGGDWDVSRCQSDGVRLDYAASPSEVRGVRRSIVHDVVSHHNKGRGLLVGGQEAQQPTDALVHGLLLLNNEDSGFECSGNPLGLRVHDVLSSFNEGYGFELSVASTVEYSDLRGSENALGLIEVTNAAAATHGQTIRNLSGRIRTSIVGSGSSASITVLKARRYIKGTLLLHLREALGGPSPNSFRRQVFDVFWDGTYGTVNTTAGSDVVTGLVTTAGTWRPGMPVSAGATFPPGTTIKSSDGGGQLTLSKKATASATAQGIYQGAIDAAGPAEAVGSMDFISLTLGNLGDGRRNIIVTLFESGAPNGTELVLEYQFHGVVMVP